MVSKKNNIARTTGLATALLISLTLVSGCSSTESDTQTELKTTQNTVMEAQKETGDTEQGTEQVAEGVDETEETQVTEEITEQVTEQSEVPKETQVTPQEPEQSEVQEKEVLFRIRISNPDAEVYTHPSVFEFGEAFPVEYDSYFNVYKIWENTHEGYTFYEFKMEDGKVVFIEASYVEICE